MRKLVAVLGLMVCLACKADQYRAGFTPVYPLPDEWAGGVCYPYGSGGDSFVISSVGPFYMYFNSPNIGYLVIDIKPTWCGANWTIGHAWAEKSTDGGITWAVVSGSAYDLTMPDNCEEAKWLCHSNGALGTGIVVVNCTDGP